MNDNITLLRRYSSGDKEALEELVKENMGLVRSIALRFTGRGCEFDDLMQIGSIGLLRAARSFDESRGCMFSTYAVPLIIGEIKRFLRDDGIIKVSRSLKSTGLTVMKNKELFLQQYGREATVSELASFCGITVEEVVQSVEACSPISSLSDVTSPDEQPLEYYLPGEKENPADAITDKIALSEAIRKLPEQRRKIIYLRFFKDMSQQQTATALGITQVKVSREEKLIFEQLRKALKTL